MQKPSNETNDELFIAECSHVGSGVFKNLGPPFPNEDSLPFVVFNNSFCLSFYYFSLFLPPKISKSFKKEKVPTHLCRLNNNTQIFGVNGLQALGPSTESRIPN